MNRTVCKLLSVIQAIFTDLAQKGFCLPPEALEEDVGEGSTKFGDVEHGGLGEGQGMKDVSDQIESEDQLEDTFKNDQERNKSDDPDVQPEENAVEMSGDFEGKMQDVDQQQKEENEAEDEDSDDEADELDVKMGDVDDEAEKLDEAIWGDEDADEEDDEKKKKEESGPGDQRQTKSELVAKDDNDQESNDAGKDSVDDSKDDDQKDPKINEPQTDHNDDVDDDQLDADYMEDDAKKADAQTSDDPGFPEDMNLDMDDKDEDEGQSADQTPDQTAPNEEITQDTEMDDEQTEMEPEDAPMPDDSSDKVDDGNEGVDVDQMDTEFPEQPDEHEEDVVSAGLEPKSDVDKEEVLDDKTTPDVPDDKVIESYGTKRHDVTNVQTVESSQDQACDSESLEKELGPGYGQSVGQLGNEGQKSHQVSEQIPKHNKNQWRQNRPGRTDDKRSLGSVEDRVEKSLQINDGGENKPPGGRESELYEHIQQGDDIGDRQTLDVANKDQLEQQATENIIAENEDGDDVDENRPDMEMEDKIKEDEADQPELSCSAFNMTERSNQTSRTDTTDKDNVSDTAHVAVDGDIVQTMTVQRGQSTIHTVLAKLEPRKPLDVEKLRLQLQDQLIVLPHGHVTSEQRRLAEETWRGFEAITCGLSRDLCEQLRLILEPTLAAKLRGDYRTGKRLNMRKVIPYIASQFRKDKIWLRRTKPSKRTYQILLAIDDSSSMVDNHSKQLAFESLCLVSNALMLLEAGELAIVSFGETVELLHEFGCQFTSRSGAEILTRFTFQQNKTKIAQLLDRCSRLLLDSRGRQRGQVSELSQLLVIVSDGRGIFLDGMETVQRAVRRARMANVFIVFVIIDNPDNKDSILDIMVPVFRDGGQLPEIKSYMEHFPFPFYVILRDIDSLPHIMGDALRQWFELITSQDRF